MATTTRTPPSVYMTLEEVAALCRVSRESCYRWLREKRLPPSRKIGHRRLWRRDEVEAAIEATAE